jgi:DNA-binding NarL/FixJ family response regulator/AraC-like DNA-binding protein
VRQALRLSLHAPHNCRLLDWATKPRTQLMRNQRLSDVRNWRALAEQARFEPARLAKGAGVSPRALEKFFKARAGRSPRDWLRELRLRVAAQGLAAGLAVEAVVEDLGFWDRAQFYHQFRGLFGETPGDFLDSWQKRERVYLASGEPVSPADSPSLDLARAVEELEAQLTSGHPTTPIAEPELARIALVDADASVTRKVQEAFALLSAPWRLNAYSPSDKDLVDQLGEDAPVAVIVGCGESKATGRALLQRLINRLPQARIITLRDVCDLDEAVLAYAAGALGCVLRSAPPGQLVQTLQAVLDGKTAFCEPAQAAMVELLGAILKKLGRGGALGPREQEIGLLQMAHNVKDIARLVDISAGTVHALVRRLQAKTNAHK